MRWWAGVCAVAAVVVLAACGTSGGRGSAAGGPSHSDSTGPSAGTPAPTSAAVPTTSPPSPTTSPKPSKSAVTPSSSAHDCVSGQVQVTVAPGDPPRQRLCVRPGTVVALVLEPRVDDKRWTAGRSSAPVFVVVSGWRVDADGTAHATLRCAGTRGGGARMTALAKAPDVAGAAGVAFTLDVTVPPYRQEG